jgi:hypothetical protein
LDYLYFQISGIPAMGFQVDSNAEIPQIQAESFGAIHAFMLKIARDPTSNVDIRNRCLEVRFLDAACD